MINAEHAEPAEARLRRPGLHGRPAAPSDRPQTRIIKPQYAFVFRADTDGASLRESRRSRASLVGLYALCLYTSSSREAKNAVRQEQWMRGLPEERIVSIPVSLQILM